MVRNALFLCAEAPRRCRTAGDIASHCDQLRVRSQQIVWCCGLALRQDVPDGRDMTLNRAGTKDSILQRIVTTFRAAIDGEMRSMQERLGPFEIPLGNPRRAGDGAGPEG